MNRRIAIALTLVALVLDAAAILAIVRGERDPTAMIAILAVNTILVATLWLVRLRRRSV